MHDWVAKRIETIDKYHPDMLWFDMNTDHSWDPLKLRVAAYYFNRAREWGKEVAISAKTAAWVSGQIMDYEREGRAPMELTDWVWQPDDPITDKFGYVKGSEALPGRPVRLEDRREREQERQSPAQHLTPRRRHHPAGTAGRPAGHRQVARCERRGDLLHPPVDQVRGRPRRRRRRRGDGRDPREGRICRPDQRAEPGRPRGGGGGISRNGYTPQDIRFTTHGDTLYATVMSWPGDEPITITSLARANRRRKSEGVELLGHAGPLRFTQENEGLKVTFPPDKPCDFVYSLKITGLKLPPPAPVITS